MSGIDETALAAATAAVTAEIARYWNDDTVEPGHGPVAEAAVRAYLAALAPQQAAPMPGVEVKPLEWRFFNVKHDYGQGVWDANHAYGTFTILDCLEKFGDEERYCVRDLSQAFPDLEAAQAAVFKEFEARIRSALATPEAGTSEPVPCKSCGGSGSVADYVGDAMRSVETPCYRCMGSGVAPAPAQAPIDGEAVRAAPKCRHCLDGLGSYNCFCTGYAAPSARKEP